MKKLRKFQIVGNGDSWNWHKFSTLNFSAILPFCVCKIISKNKIFVVKSFFSKNDAERFKRGYGYKIRFFRL